MKNSCLLLLKLSSAGMPALWREPFSSLVFFHEPLDPLVGDRQGPCWKLNSVRGQQSLYLTKVLPVLSPRETEEEWSWDLSVPIGFFTNWVCVWESCSGDELVTGNCEWLRTHLAEAGCLLYRQDGKLTLIEPYLNPGVRIRCWYDDFPGNEAICMIMEAVVNTS